MFDNDEAFSFAAALVGGVLLGGFYFGGLWWTVRRMTQTRAPLNWYFGSLVCRLAIVLLVVYGVLTLFDWPQLVALLIGLIAARILLVRIWGRPVTNEALHREAV